jgi:hypothetical protein
LHERIGGAVVAAVPRLACGRLHLLDQTVDGGFEAGAVEIGERAAQVEHPAVGRPPHAQVARLMPSPPFLDSRLLLGADHAGQVDRRDLRRPPGPLGVARLIRELGNVAELLVAQRPGMRGGRDARQ